MLCARLHRYLPWLNTHLYLWCVVTWNHTHYSKSHFSTLLNDSKRIFGWTDAKINEPNEWANSDFITNSNTSSGEIYTTQPVSNQKTKSRILGYFGRRPYYKAYWNALLYAIRNVVRIFRCCCALLSSACCWSNSKRKHKYLASICFLSAQYATRVHTHTHLK